MANTSIIQLKRSNTVFHMPAANTLAPGELAVNLTDGRLFLQLQNGHVVDISSTPAGKTYYVSTTGNDQFDGTTPGASKATIRAAVAAAVPGDTVFIHSGLYTEITPIIVPQQVQICGAGERNTIIKPIDSTKDIFWMNNNGYVTGVKFTVEFGGTAEKDQIELNIPGESGLVLVVPGLPLNNSAVVRGFAASANLVSVLGYVNRVS